MKKKTIWDMNRPSLEQFREQEKMPVVLVVDNVRSLNNIGSLFRTSDAFALQRIILCGISATPPSNEIHKTALGAEDSVEWSHWGGPTHELLVQLENDGYTTCCLEQVVDSIPLQDFPVDFAAGSRYAIVVGNEVHGVDPQAVDCASHCIEIPQSGTKHSLNVAVSAGVALWHFYKNWLARPQTK